MGTPHGPHPVTHAPLPIAKSLHQETALTTLVDQPKAAIMSDRLNFHHEKKKITRLSRPPTDHCAFLRCKYSFETCESNL